MVPLCWTRCNQAPLFLTRHPSAAPILVVLWLFFSGILFINLFIAMMSNTFQVRPPPPPLPSPGTLAEANWPVSVSVSAASRASGECRSQLTLARLATTCTPRMHARRASRHTPSQAVYDNAQDVAIMETASAIVSVELGLRRSRLAKHRAEVRCMWLGYGVLVYASRVDGVRGAIWGMQCGERCSGRGAA